MSKQWSPEEKKAARRIFDLAASNARGEILRRHQLAEIEFLDELWQHEQTIRRWRRDYQQVFQYTYSHLEVCFATCLNRG